ncbi:MAG: PQQ-binding-like beta-propeller repeat protein [Miltoncostaeaceae bacterium]
MAALIVAIGGACSGGGGESIQEIDFSFAEPDTLAAPERVAVGGETAWFTVDGGVAAVDVATRAPGGLVDLPEFSKGIAADESAAWVAFDDDTVRRVDAATGSVSAPIRVAPQPDFSVDAKVRGPMAVAGDAVWVVLTDGIARIDRETLRPFPEALPIPGVIGLVADGNRVWVTSRGRLLRLAAATGRVNAEVEVGEGAGGIAVDNGVVWVRAGDVITGHDAVTLDPLGEPLVFEGERSTSLGGAAPSSVVAGAGALWGVEGEANIVVRVDPETGEILDEYELSSPNSSQRAELSRLAFGADAVWVGTAIGNRAGVIDP